MVSLASCSTCWRSRARSNSSTRRSSRRSASSMPAAAAQIRRAFPRFDAGPPAAPRGTSRPVRASRWVTRWSSGSGAVAHERELDGIAVGGQLLPRAGDPRQDARAAGLRRGGQVGRVDGRGGVHGVLDLLVAVGRAKAIHDDVVDVAGAVNLDADGHGGVRRARLLVSKEKAAVQPGEQPLVAVAGDADARRSWPRLRGGHGASMNAGVARSARAVASTTSAVSGLSGKTVRIADGMSLWVKSEYV